MVQIDYVDLIFHDRSRIEIDGVRVVYSLILLASHLELLVINLFKYLAFTSPVDELLTQTKGLDNIRTHM